MGGPERQSIQTKTFGSTEMSHQLELSGLRWWIIFPFRKFFILKYYDLKKLIITQPK